MAGIPFQSLHVTDSEDSVLAKERAKTEELTAKLQHLFSGSNDYLMTEDQKM